MTSSRMLRKLRAGEVARIVNISRVREPWLTELAGRTGFDVIWLDMEHRHYGYEVIEPMALACRATGIDLMVRILKTGYSSPMRALEFGANGIMVPHCRDAAEARQYVEWCRFPPLGRRGFDGAGADADYAQAAPLEHIRHANAETFLVLQIEDREAVECVEEIAAVEGVDALFVGPADLTISLGIPFQFEHPLFRQAVERVAAAAARAGRAWGLAAGSPAMAQGSLDMGARLITCGSDHGWLLRGMQESWRGFGAIGAKGE